MKRVFLNFANTYVSSCLLKFDYMKNIHRTAIKALIKGVFSRSFCCYGNILCHENDNNVFTNDDWAGF